MAEIVFPQNVTGQLWSIPAAATAAKGRPLAAAAVPMNLGRFLKKANFQALGVHFRQCVLAEIADAIAIQHIKIARIYAAVGLNGILDSAVAQHSAGLWLASNTDPQ